MDTEKQNHASTPKLPLTEFIILTAMMISLVALSIDAMLPALLQIGQDLNVAEANDVQLIVSTLLLGMAAGQMIFGPLSDSVGRKPPIYAGIILFAIGCLLSMFASSFSTMLAGRLLQGIGVSGPRAVMVALVRDQYQGRAMARVMSFVMAVFILVPAIAPALGQGILLLADWRAIFATFLAIALVNVSWFAIRQPETLPVEQRIPFSIRRITAAIAEVFSIRVALGYTIATGIIFGPFIGFLNMAPQILQQQYGLGTRFPLYFAILALAIGCASILNAQLVMRFGMRVLSRNALIISCLLSVCFLLIVLFLSGQPPLWALMLYLCVSFFCMGMLFGNLNAMAMEPLGHIAGVGAAVVGSLSTLISVPLGALLGRGYNGTVLPLIAGFTVLGIAALITVLWVQRGQKYEL